MYTNALKSEKKSMNQTKQCKSHAPMQYFERIYVVWPKDLEVLVREKQGTNPIKERSSECAGVTNGFVGWLCFK